MSEKSGFFPSTPSSEKSTSIITGNKKALTTVGIADKGREKGVSKGGRERAMPCEAILKCPHCGRCVKIVFPVEKPPEWVRCVWCNELQPADGYHVVMYGLDLPRVLSPYEVEARKRERELAK